MSGEPRTLHEDVDAKFWSIPGQADPAAQPSPDGKWVAFLSDREGWDHLYVMPADEARAADGARRLPPSLKLRRTAEALAEAGQPSGAEPIQITKGRFE